MQNVLLQLHTHLSSQVKRVCFLNRGTVTCTVPGYKARRVLPSILLLCCSSTAALTKYLFLHDGAWNAFEDPAFLQCAPFYHPSTLESLAVPMSRF